MSGLRSITERMDSLIEPRCTGMCGALAISWPWPSKSAQLKSSRSLMLTECAVFWSRSPICSAMFMKRLLKTSSTTGSASVPSARVRARSRMRVSSRSPEGCSSARQPASTTVVALRSATIAGPSMRAPGLSASR